MKRLIAATLIACSLFAAPAVADERGAEAEATMKEYLRLWNLHDAAAVTSRIYRFSDAGNALGTVEGLQRNFDSLKAQGYDHSEAISLETCLLTDTTALSEFRFTRLKSDGSPLGPRERVSLYLLRKFPDGWRITQMLGMDYAANLTCSSPPAG